MAPRKLHFTFHHFQNVRQPTPEIENFKTTYEKAGGDFGKLWGLVARLSTVRSKLRPRIRTRLQHALKELHAVYDAGKEHEDLRMDVVRAMAILTQAIGTEATTEVDLIVAIAAHEMRCRFGPAFRWRDVKTLVCFAAPKLFLPTTSTASLQMREARALARGEDIAAAHAKYFS